jgi:hypothetical protein
MAIRLIAVDLDDTLLDHNRTISVRTKRTIQAAVDQGVKLVIATGRMYCSALPFAQQLGLAVPLITYNGALIKCSSTGEVLLHRPVDQPTATELLALCRQNNWYIQVYLDDVLYVKERDARARYYENIAGITAVAVGDAIYSMDQQPTKLLTVAEPEELGIMEAIIRQQFAGRLYVTSSKANYLEFANPQVNKGNGVAFLADKMGIFQEEVMAVGDSLNDMDMIQYAGIGVAMGNARPTVKAVARWVTEDNDQDGVAVAIEKYVLTAGY